MSRDGDCVSHEKTDDGTIKTKDDADVNLKESDN